MERLSRDGVLLCFEDAGKGAPPVLLIHDLGADHTSLGAQFQHLRGRHRVIAVDLLGHGQSDSLPRAYTVADFADDAGWLCYEVGLYRPVLVGRGIGGAIAVNLADRCPDLVAAVVVLPKPAAPPAETRGRPYLAGTWQNAKEWDGHVAGTACNIPLLYFEDEKAGEHVNGQHEFCPSIVVASLGSGHQAEREINEQVNAVIDAFLDRI